jgi:hypothetical protein
MTDRTTNAVETSWTHRTLTAVNAQISSAVETSWTHRILTAVNAQISSVSHESGTRRWLTSTVGGRVRASVRGSYLYRWLTAEPDPDVIVIDLRETWTVGPVITMLDWLLGIVENAAERSPVVARATAGYERTLAAPIRVGGGAALVTAALAGVVGIVSGGRAALFLAAALLAVGLLGRFEDRSWAELRQTRPVELLIAALEPPAPPGSEQRQPTDDGQTTQPDADEPEGDARHDPHQDIDREIADDGARGERDQRDHR